LSGRANVANVANVLHFAKSAITAISEGGKKLPKKIGRLEVAPRAKTMAYVQANHMTIRLFLYHPVSIHSSNDLVLG